MNDLQPINLPGLDPRRPLVIAGPCSAETEEQVIETARELAAIPREATGRASQKNLTISKILG